MSIYNRDPYKEPGWRLMRVMGYVKAEIHFSGGNDQGCVDKITLWDDNGEEHDLDPWYPSYYTMETTAEPQPPYGHHLKYIPDKTPQVNKEKLAHLLQRPVEDEYESFAGDFYVDGTVTWDARSQTITMEKEEETSSTSHERYEIP